MSNINFIIPCFNCSNTVEATILSVQNVFGPEATILCVDDGSRDDTLQKLEELRVKFDNLSVYSVGFNAGPGHARNVGLSKLEGWVSFLDADDAILPAYYLFFKSILKYGDKKALHVGGYEVRKDGKKLLNFYPPDTLSELEILRQCPISCLSTIFYNDPKLNLRFGNAPREDLEFWYHILFHKGYNYRSSSRVVGVYNLNRGSRSSRVFKKTWLQYRTLNKFIGIPWYTSIFLTFSWMKLGWLKYRGEGQNEKL